MNMENHIYEKWLLELEQELALLEGLDVTPLERLRHALPITNQVLNDLRAAVLKDGFINQQAEIYFFKRIKPRFNALQLWEMLTYDLTMRIPVGTQEMVKTFYEQELLQVLDILKGNSFHYQYYKTGASELDQAYFVRDAKISDIPVLELIDPYPGFSTALDYSFAKYIAYERLRDHLLDQLSNEYVRDKIAKDASQTQIELKWTGDSINLVELAYGIWLTKQINNGHASITEIISWLEMQFHVKIGTAFRRWQSISRRKRVSTTKYIDEMKESLLKRLDDENGK